MSPRCCGKLFVVPGDQLALTSLPFIPMVSWSYGLMVPKCRADNVAIAQKTKTTYPPHMCNKGINSCCPFKIE